MLDELGLGAGAEGGGDHRAGDGGGGFGSVGGADEVEAEVDTGGGTGRGPDSGVLDEQGVGFHLDLRMAGGQGAGQVPVGHGAATVQESGAGEDEGAGAERGDRDAGGVGAAEGVEDGGRELGVGVFDAGDEDQVGGGEVVEPGEWAVGGEGETAAQGDGGVRVGGRPAEFEGWDTTEGAVAAPDLGDDGDVERADAGEGEERDALGAGCGGRRRLRHGWQ